MNEFLKRLKQRKIVQWSLAYVAAAFALLQGIDIIAQRFGWPEQTMRFVIIALSVGLFVTLVLAWYHGERGAQRINGTELLILALLLAIGGGFLWRFGGMARAPVITSAAAPAAMPATSIPEKSIAVLPFVSLSKDEDNMFFADGVQDQILTNLAKVAGLKVISRTSVMQYRNAAARNLREIAQQLGVIHVLEGSVQRAAGKVRVTAQLIDARNDAHEWAENYDRPIDDVFAIQSEIAKTIAEQLQVHISPHEEAAMSRAPTTDLVAQNLYVRARELSTAGPNDPNGKQDLLDAVRLVNEALARDPRFFLAYILLAQVHDNLYWGGFDHAPTRLELEEAAIESAARLQPDAGEVHLVRALYAYHAHRDYDRARAELEIAGKTLPNDPQVYYFTALIDRRQARWEDALRNFDRALELDPRNLTRMDEAGQIYQGLRRYAESSRLYQQAVAIRPDYYFVRSQLATNAFWERADTGPLEKLASNGAPEQTEMAQQAAPDLLLCALAKRDRSTAMRAVAAMRPEGFQDTGSNLLLPREWFAGLVARTFGDKAAADAAFKRARAIIEKTLGEQTDYAAGWSFLGLIDAALDRKDDAIREGRHACELLPTSADALTGPFLVQNLALIYTWTGNKDLALQELSKAAELPFGISYGELKLLPMWDPLRGEPRFEKIVASLAPKGPAVSEK